MTATATSAARVAEAAVGGGDADGAGDGAAVIEDRRRQAASANFVFVAVLGDATGANPLQLGAEAGRVGDCPLCARRETARHV
jgi:hypothetical protein